MVESNMASGVASTSRPRHDSATSTQRLPPDLTSGYPLTAQRPTNHPPVNGRRSRTDMPDRLPQSATSGVSGQAQIPWPLVTGSVSGLAQQSTNVRRPRRQAVDDLSGPVVTMTLVRPPRPCRYKCSLPMPPEGDFFLDPKEPTPYLSIGGTRPSPNSSAQVFCNTSRRPKRRPPGGRSEAATSLNPRRRSSIHGKSHRVTCHPMLRGNPNKNEDEE
ncbi:hypothetical protein BHM03_00057136 [Ensete ventricosum]|nr:hypothetical protein BHM03_00057136 [Ensete ventricosum]